MKPLLTSIAAILLSMAHGQVSVDTRIHFTGQDAERAVEGLGAPASQDAAVTVSASLIGTTTWATATVNGMAVTLQPSAPLTDHRDGTVLRFVAPAAVHGPATLAAPQARNRTARPVAGRGHRFTGVRSQLRARALA